MDIFSAFKKKDEIGLVFDVGSSSVGAALFRMQSSGVPKIIFSMREQIALEESVDFDRFFANTVKTFEMVAGKVSQKGAGAPSKIFCVLASPWIISETRTIRVKKDVPFLFSQKLADNLVQKEITLFEEEYKKRSDAPAGRDRPIEFKNMKTMLNGYQTEDPVNQHTRELEMSLFISMCPDDLLQKIEQSAFRHFHTHTVKFSSFMMASFAVARDMFVHQDSFLLVDIGGEVTDISMIKKDTLSESAAFPMGRNFMIRGTAEGMKSSLAEAQSLISLYKDGHAARATEKKLDTVIGKLKTDWLKKFQETLAGLSTDISIPATIFITIDQDFTELFSTTIKNEEFNQYTLTESKFRVIFLGIQALHGIAEFEESAARDAFLIIESIYINRFLS